MSIPPTRKKSRLRETIGALDRAVLLVGVFVLWLTAAALLDHYLDSGEVYRRIFHPLEADKKAGLEWHHLVQMLVVVLGLPVAYMLWHWRDLNARATLDNARKDTNLREFQELQLRAAGGVSNEKDAAVGQTLQIAALHQMRSFLRGDYGESFRRPAFELFCALLGRPKELTQIHGDGQADAAEQADERQFPLAPPVYRALRTIVEEDWEPFFRSGFPLTNRSFQNLRLSRYPYLAGLDFSASDLSGSQFYNVTFGYEVWAGTSLKNVAFFQCQIWGGELRDCKYAGAEFEECNLEGVKLEGGDVISAHFNRSDLTNAKVKGTGGYGFTVTDCDLMGCEFQVDPQIAPKLTLSRFDRTTVMFDIIDLDRFAEAPTSPGYLIKAISPQLSRDVSSEAIKRRWLAAGAIYKSSTDETMTGHELATDD